MIICPVLSQQYYFSKYEDQTIVRGDAVGGIEFHGKNTIMVEDIWDWYATNWVVQIDGLVNFSFHKGGVPYNLKYYDCTNLTLRPPGEDPRQFYFETNMLTALSGNITFNEIVTNYDAAKGKGGYNIDGLTFKGVTGELTATLGSEAAFSMEGIRVDFRNQSLVPDSPIKGDDYITFYSKGVIHVKATISNSGSIWVPLEKIDWTTLNGKLKIREFSGTAVQSGKNFFGDLTVEGKDIRIVTNQYPRPDYGAPDEPPRYWNIEVTFTDGQLVGNYYPFWGVGAIIGIVAIVVLCVIGYVYWWTNKNKKVIIVNGINNERPRIR